MSDWTSVKDRLPEEDCEKRMLAYGCAECDGACNHEPHVQFCIYYTKGFRFGEYDCPLNATHWMPLPNPPEVFDCENCLKEKCVRVESESWSARQRRVCQAGCGELSTLPKPPEES
jgi:hypothetical protein